MADLLLVAVLLLAQTSLGALLPPMTNGSPDEFALRRAGTEVNASYQIGVTNAGLYRIPYSALVTAGITNPVGSELRLFCQTQEVAIYVSTPGAMAAADYALFYGQGYNGYYTPTNVYWLGTGGSGLRMATRSGAPIGGANVVTSHWHEVLFNPDTSYIDNVRQGDESIDHWYAARLFDTSSTNVLLPTDRRISSGPAQLVALLGGRNNNTSFNPDHQTEVRVSGTVVANFQFESINRLTGGCSVAGSLLNSSSTTVSLRQTMAGVPFDFALLESLAIQYTRLLAPLSNALGFFGRTGTNIYSVDGFSTNAAYWVADISNPWSPVLLTNFSTSSITGGVRLRFGDTSLSSNQYFVCATSAVVTVTNVRQVLFRDLAATNRQADYIVICPYEFRKNAYRLLAHRYRHGLTVAVAPVTDIYNEFSYGIKDAAAIKQFLGYAYHHWQPPAPRYVVLGGDGSYDPENNLNLANPIDIIPVHLGPSSYEWTCLDGWYCAVNGSDRLVDIAWGRLPASSETQMSNMVGNIVAYEAQSSTNAWRKKGLLVADSNDVPDALYFKAATTSNVSRYLSSSNGYVNTPVFMDDLPYQHNPALARAAITTTINTGIYVVSYFGHGSEILWNELNIFNTNDASQLLNTVYPLFTALTCLNGRFYDQQKGCLAEALVIRAGRGSVGCVAATSLSIETYAEVFANGFYEALVNTQQYTRVGDVMSRGLLKLWAFSPAAEELLFYNLFGDPALVVKPSF